MHLGEPPIYLSALYVHKVNFCVLFFYVGIRILLVPQCSRLFKWIFLHKNYFFVYRWTPKKDLKGVLKCKYLELLKWFLCIETVFFVEFFICICLILFQLTMNNFTFLVVFFYLSDRFQWFGIEEMHFYHLVCFVYSVGSLIKKSSVCWFIKWNKFPFKGAAYQVCDWTEYMSAFGIGHFNKSLIAQKTVCSFLLDIN